ncbi:MAG: plasma-membrane proton-efflux P-type ATPase [Candidatus Bilamarchaeaceae archaeon]
MTLMLKPTMDYKPIDAPETLKQLESSVKGLASGEAEARAARFGRNEITEKKTDDIAMFLGNFWNPMAWLLEFAVFLTYIMGDHFDAIIIFLLLFSNAVIEFLNDRSSRKALNLLKKKLVLKTNTLRDGSWSVREACELVPGDIVTVGLGDVVPADLKVIEGELSVDQAALTGESLPVNVKGSGLLYTGSVIKRGEATCVVLNTGMRTYFGKTVELVDIAKPKSRQQEVMLKICDYTIQMGAAAFLLIVLYALDIDTTLRTVMTFAVLFIGGGIPVALPIMFTVSQAKGAGELAQKNILVTKLNAMENAASVQVLCLDKTGTITMNDLEVSEAVPFSGISKGDVVLYSFYASNGSSKDAIDQAVIKYARKEGVDTKGCSQLSFTPFEPATKRSEAMVKTPSSKGKQFKVMKGAPQVLMSLCKGMTDKDRKAVQAKIDSLSATGCRVLGVARSACGKPDDVEFAGLLALSDPIRPDTKEMIMAMRANGVRPLMLTGDSLPVAKEIAEQAGIGPNIVRASDLRDLPEGEKRKAIASIDGLAEIYPEDKFAVVKHLQSLGYMVGMTGDGVNDAPALKQAEMGIAVSNSTDVAKAAASLVLLDPGIRVIEEAVMTSRRIYERMLTWTLNKIVKVVQFLALLTLGFVWFHDVIVSISGLLILVLVNDFMTMSLAMDNAKSARSPNKWNVKNIMLSCIIIGLLFFLEGVAAIVVGLEYFHLDFEGIKTITLLGLVYTSQFRLFIVRERDWFWSSWPCKEVLITIAFTLVVFTLMALHGVVMEPLSSDAVAFSFVLALVATLLFDIPKYYAFRWFGLVQDGKARG